MFAMLASLAGCSTLSPMGLNPGSHRLLDSARKMRASAPIPLPVPRELDKQALPPYIVEPGDVLLVQPAEFDSPARLPTDQPVQPDGTIELGRYGRLIAAGKTVEQIETEVQNLVAAQTRDAGPITVRLVGRQSKVFYVLGEVNAPGAYPLDGRETVLDAIVIAGGLTRAANQGEILLSQPSPPDGCRRVLPVCYREIVQLGDTSTNYQLAPGDRIYVSSLTWLEQLFESLFPCGHVTDCAPCGGPQVPCIAVPHVEE